MTHVFPVEIGSRLREEATNYAYNTVSSLPGGLAVSRSGTTATVYDASLMVTNPSANTARYSYDPERKVVDGLLVEPATTNKQRNTGGIAASDTSTFNTTSGTGAGTWGTLPSFTSLVIPAADAYGSTTGWQIAAIGNLADGTQYVDYRFKCVNNAPVDPTNASANAKSMRLTLSSATPANMIPAVAGETWTLSYLLAIIAGSPTATGGIRTSMAAYNGAPTTSVFFEEKPQPVPTSTLAFQSHAVTFPLATTIDRFASFITFVIRAQDTLDVTFRVAHRQTEKQPAATSFLKATGADVSRGADTVTTTVTAGTWYVRWEGHYRNFDASYTTGDGNLSLTIPQEAVAAGVFQFSGIRLSSQPLPPDLRKLRYSRPPATGVPYVVNISANGGGMPTSTEISPITGNPYGTDPAYRFYEDNVDVIAVMPVGGVVGNLKIIGGRSVTIIGGAFLPSDSAGFLDPTLRFMLTLSGQKEFVYMEGVRFDASGTALALDAIRLSGIRETPLTPRPLYAPDFIGQNIRVENLHGTFLPSTDHADVLQVTSPIGRIFLDNVTGYSSYQGLFMPNVRQDWEQSFFPPGTLDRPIPPMYIEERYLSRCDLHWKSSVYGGDNASQIWFMNTPGINSGLGAPGDEFPCPTMLLDVYTEQNPALSWEETSVWPGTATPFTDDPYWFGNLAEDGKSLSWVREQSIRGCVKKWQPGMTEFVPSGIAGDYYKTPGSRNLPLGPFPGLIDQGA